MTGTTTGQTSLPTATDSDDTESYLVTSLVSALQALANLFESATGHDHTGAGKGKPIGSAGIASGITLTSPVINGALTGTAGFSAWTTFTPTITQSGNVTASVANGRYTQIGKLVVGTVDITISSAGTAGFSIIIGGLPVAAFTGSMTIGAGTYLLAVGSTRYVLGISMASTTSFGFYTHAATGNFGVNPAVTAATGDILRATFSYEAA